MHRESQIHKIPSSLFLLIITWHGLLDGIKWFAYISKSQLFVRLILPERFWFVNVVFDSIVNLQFITQSKFTISPNHSNLVSYSFSAN